LSQVISVEVIKELRARTSAGISDCKNALNKTQGDLEAAIEVLKQRGRIIAEKKAGRVVQEGLIESYIHHSGHVGVLLELNCETDFVAKTDDFKQMAHDLAMQVAAMSPQYLCADDLNDEDELDPKQVCLLEQPFVKEPSKPVKDVIAEAIAKVGENIKIRRFNRYEIGS
jgi:elongation factor Ts